MRGPLRPSARPRWSPGGRSRPRHSCIVPHLLDQCAAVPFPVAFRAGCVCHEPGVSGPKCHRAKRLGSSLGVRGPQAPSMATFQSNPSLRRVADGARFVLCSCQPTGRHPGPALLINVALSGPVGHKPRTPTPHPRRSGRARAADRSCRGLTGSAARECGLAGTSCTCTV